MVKLRHGEPLTSLCKSEVAILKGSFAHNRYDAAITRDLEKYNYWFPYSDRYYRGNRAFKTQKSFYSVIVALLAF